MQVDEERAADPTSEGVEIEIVATESYEVSLGFGSPYLDVSIFQEVLGMVGEVENVTDVRQFEMWRFGQGTDLMIAENGFICWSKAYQIRNIGPNSYGSRYILYLSSFSLISRIFSHWKLSIPSSELWRFTTE